MHVFSALFQLHLQSRTLKEKRGIVKSVIARARNNFNVAAAEVDQQDIPGSALLAFVTVSEGRVQGRRLLELLEERMVEERPDIEVVMAHIEERCGTIAFPTGRGILSTDVSLGDENRY